MKINLKKERGGGGERGETNVSREMERGRREGAERQSGPRRLEWKSER